MKIAIGFLLGIMVSAATAQTLTVVRSIAMKDAMGQFFVVQIDNEGRVICSR